MTKLLNATLAFAMVSGAMAVPLSAQDADQEIIVQPISSQTALAGELARALDAQLSRANLPRWVDEAGIVRVRFLTNGSGTTENVMLFESSGNPYLDRAAVRAVSRIDGVSAVPGAGSSHQEVQANIIFANSPLEMQQLARRLEREEAMRPPEPYILALNLAPARRN